MTGCVWYHQSWMHGASLQELSWVPCSVEIHQEQIYRIRDWWDVIQQWESIHRTTLQTHTASVDDFIELLVYSVDNITTHSFFAKIQVQHLKQRKEEITDRVYHSLGLWWKLSLYGVGWNLRISLEQDQCTMHPVVIYFKKDGVLYHISLCIISDDLEHDSCFVHELQRIAMIYIKENLSQI